MYQYPSIYEEYKIMVEKYKNKENTEEQFSCWISSHALATTRET